MKAPLLLLAILALAGCGAAGSAPTVSSNGAAPAGKAAGYKLRLGYISTVPTPNNGVEAYAFKQGALLPALKDSGITDIEWSGFGNGPDLIEALTGGSLDAGILGDTPALVARASGQKNHLINQTRVGMDAWLMTSVNGPKSVSDLAGKNVATQKGSYMHRYLIGVLQESGIVDRVTVTHMATADGAAALQRGDIAAYAMPISTAVLPANRNLPVIDKASQHQQLVGSTLTIASDAFLAKHPDFPNTWNRARKLAVDAAKSRPDQYWAFEAQAVNQPAAAIQQAYPLDNYAGEPFTPDGLQLLAAAKKFLLDQNLAKSDFDLAAWRAGSGQ